MSCTQTFLRVAVRCNRTRKEERVKDTSTTRGNKKKKRKAGKNEGVRTNSKMERETAKRERRTDRINNTDLITEV